MCKSPISSLTIHSKSRNVVAVDYRGFGDSTGVPSESGLLIDARTVYDYVSDLITRQRDNDLGLKGAAGEIILVGQSLGTGVVSALAGNLAQEGELQCPSSCSETSR